MSIENWIYEPVVLKEISRHFETGEALPDVLIEQLVKTRFINKGLVKLIDLHFSKFDLAIHSQTLESTGKCIS